MVKNKKLKIIIINVVSIAKVSNRVELGLLVRRQRPDIMMLQETRLDIRHKVTIDGYTLYRADRDKTKKTVGLGILIKDNIK